MKPWEMDWGNAKPAPPPAAPKPWEMDWSGDAGQPAAPTLTARRQRGVDMDRMREETPPTIPSPITQDGQAADEQLWSAVPLIDKAVNPLKSGVLSVKQGFEGLGADLSARSLAVMDRVDRGEQVPETQDPVGYQHMTPEQRVAARRQAEVDIAQSAGRVTRTGRDIAEIPQNPAARRMMSAKSWGDAGDAFWSDPMGVIASVGLQSLPAMAPAIAAGAVGGPLAGVLAMGGSSAGTEYLSSVLEGLAAEGVNTQDEAALVQAFRNPETMARVRDRAATRAGIIGTMDAATAGLAGKTLVPERLVRGRIAREAANIPAQVATQGAAGAAGEAGAQIATEGRITEPGQVLGEMVGEAFGAPAEVPALRHHAGPAPVEVAPPNVTAADVASPIPTDLISQGRSVIAELTAPKPPAEEVPQGAVPAETLLGPVAEEPVREDMAAPAVEVAEPTPATAAVDLSPADAPAAEPITPQTVEAPIDQERGAPEAAPIPPPPAALKPWEMDWGQEAPPELFAQQDGDVSTADPAMTAKAKEAGSAAPPPAAEQQDQQDAALLAEPVQSADTPPAGGVAASVPAPAADPIVKKDGSPFSTPQSAHLAARSRPDLKGLSLEPIKVEGGWGLRQVEERPPASADLVQSEPQAQQEVAAKTGESAPEGGKLARSESPEKPTGRDLKATNDHDERRQRGIEAVVASEEAAIKARYSRNPKSQVGRTAKEVFRRAYQVTYLDLPKSRHEGYFPNGIPSQYRADYERGVMAASAAKQPSMPDQTKPSETGSEPLQSERISELDPKTSRREMVVDDLPEDAAEIPKQKMELRRWINELTNADYERLSERYGSNAYGFRFPHNAADTMEPHRLRDEWQTFLREGRSFQALVQQEIDETFSRRRFVPAPDGSEDFGEIGLEVAAAIRRQPGKIRLREGDERAGLAHIRKGHAGDVRRRGYATVEEMVADVARNYTEIHKGTGRSLILVKREGRGSGATWVQLEPDANGDFYDVKTASPTRSDFLSKQEPVWKRPARRDEPGSNGGDATSPAPLSARVQTGEDNVAPQPGADKGEAFRLTPDAVHAMPGVEADLRARLRRYGIADQVAFKLVAAIRRADGSVVEGAEGRYTHRLIEVALDARDRSFTLDHEAVHALKRLDLIRPGEWTALRRAAIRDAERMADVRARYPEFSARAGQREQTELLVEEAVADMFGDYQRGKLGGVDSLTKRVMERVRQFLQAVREAFQGRGFDSLLDVYDDTMLDLKTAAGARSALRKIATGEVGRRGAEQAPGPVLADAHHASRQPRDDQGRFVEGEPEERFSRTRDPAASPDPQAAQERRSLMVRLAGAQPLDRVARIPFDLFGGINGAGRWQPGLYLHSKAARAITEATFKDSGRMGWANGILHRARAGLIDRYGLDAAYVERDRQRGLDERRIMAKVPELMETLKAADVKPEEMATLQAVLTGEEVPDARWEGIASPIRQAVDQLGAEAVELGLLSAEAYERNRGKYLHRVYAKHEAEQGSLAAWVNRQMTSRRRKIIGDQFKGRGMFMDVSPTVLMRHTDEVRTQRERSGRLKMLEKRRDDLLRRREVALARAEERHDEMGATLDRRARLDDALPDPAAAREAERALERLQEQRVAVERQRAEALASLSALTGESEATLARRLKVKDAAQGARPDGTQTLKPSGYQKGQAREQGVALTRQTGKAEQTRERLIRLDADLAKLDRQIERVSGDVVVGRQGLEGRAKEQSVALTRQNLRNQRARAMLDKIDSQLADVNGRIVETETRLYAGEDAAKPKKGERYRVLDKMAETTKEGEKPRVLARAYLREDQAIPKDLEGYQDRGVWEVRGEKAGRPVLWRDFTPDERRQMGEIVDARYTVAKTYMLMAHDLATGRFFRDIAQHQDWSRDGKDEPPSATWKEAGEYNRFWSDPAIQWVKVPDTKIPKSDTKRYGALSGRFVRAEIWRDLAELDAMQKPGFWDAVMRQWKANKTFRSPVVHANNIMSNVMFADMADIRATDLARGIWSLAKRDDLYREAVDQGAFGSDMLAQEIRDEVLKPILEEIERQGQGNQGAMEAMFGTAGKLADWLWSGVKTVDRKMMNAYQMEDEVFRLALYARRREQGASPEQAALEARDTFLNYDIRAPWVNAARRSVLPFISYTYRAAPMIAKTIATRPWKLAKYWTVMYALNAMAYGMSGGDEDEERRSLRENEQGWTWIGAPRMLRLPWHDEAGNPVFLDIRRWIPGGDIFDTGQGQSVIPLPSWLQPGGPLQIGAELLLNRSAFTGQDIVNKTVDDLGERVSKSAGYVYRSWMPSAAWVPGSWYWQRIGDAMEGARDWSGRPYSVPQAVASSVGIKVKPQDVEEGFANWGREFERTERALEAEARRISRDRERGLLSEKGFERRMEDLTEKFGDLDRRRRQTLEGEE